MRYFIKGLLFLLTLVFLWAAGFGLYVASIMTAKPQEPDKVTDVIVVFTGHKDRVETGLELFAQGRAAHLLISGVHPDVTPQEIESKWHGDTPLPPCCITLGHDAVNTVENAKETQAWMKSHGYKTIRLVTSNYHMNRALIELKHALPDMTIYSHPIRHADLPYDRKRFWKVAFEEYHKSLYRWATLMFSPQIMAVKHGHPA